MITQEICECGNRKWFSFCLAKHSDNKKGITDTTHEFLAVCTECGRWNDEDDLYYNHLSNLAIKRGKK